MSQNFWNELYDPYGKATLMNASWGVIASSESAWQHMHQGGRLDVTSGLYYFQMRDYSPRLGRWVTSDPIQFLGQDVNLYRYVGNDVLNWVDPNGTDRYRIGGAASWDPSDHSRIAVDTWEWDKKNEKWIKTGTITFELGTEGGAGLSSTSGTTEMNTSGASGASNRSLKNCSRYLGVGQEK
jgi:RHS repeat-associated protein